MSESEQPEVKAIRGLRKQRRIRNVVIGSLIVMFLSIQMLISVALYVQVDNSNRRAEATDDYRKLQDEKIEKILISIQALGKGTAEGNELLTCALVVLVPEYFPKADPVKCRATLAASSNEDGSFYSDGTQNDIERNLNQPPRESTEPPQQSSNTSTPPPPPAQKPVLLPGDEENLIRDDVPVIGWL